MRRGTTPTITIETDIDLTSASNLFLTFKQENHIIFEKEMSELTVEDKKVTCKLSQQDTLLLRVDRSLLFQIRGTLNGEKIASNIMSTSVSEIIKDGEILMSVNFKATFTESLGLSAAFETQIIASDKPPYEGAYDVTPSAHEAQTLETAGKLMSDDVTVRIIPFFRTSNTSGETVYIASEV